MELRIPKDYFDNPKPPEVYLCTTDKKIIGLLDCYDLRGTFKWNAYSEISFTIDRIYTDVLTGETVVNPLFDKVETPRIVYLKDIGYFILQDSDTVYSDKDSKSVTAFSLEYSCANKYLENFRVNTGEVDSVEVTHYVNQLGTEDYYNEDKKYKLATVWDEYEVYYIKDYTDKDSYVWTQVQVKDEDDYTTYDGSTVAKTLYVKNYPNVRFYNPSQPELSLVHLILKKIPEWTIGYVDPALWHKERKFDEDRIDVYSFFTNEVSDTFKCVVSWNTLDSSIDFYEEAEDGINDDNTIQTRWDTDVYISRDNLANEINIKVSADNIKTKLKVSGADDIDIREVNLGKNYIMNLDYYHTEEWMGKELYDRYSEYLKAISEAAKPYNEASQGRVSAYNKWNDLMNAVPVEGNVLLVGDPFERLCCTYTPIDTAYLNIKLDDSYKNKTFTDLYSDKECTTLIDKTKCEAVYIVQGYEFVYQEGTNNFLCKYFLNLNEFPKRLGIYGVNKDTKANVSDNVLLILKNDEGDRVEIRVYNSQTEKNPAYRVKVIFEPGDKNLFTETWYYHWQDWIRGKLTLEYLKLDGKNLVIASIGTLGAYLCLAKDERQEENLEDYGVRLLQEREKTYLKIFETQTENMFSNQGYHCVAGDEEPTASMGSIPNGSKWFDTSGETVVLREYNSTSDPHWTEVNLNNGEDSNYHNYQRYIDNYNKLLAVQDVLARKQMEADYWMSGYEVSTKTIDTNTEHLFEEVAIYHFNKPVQTKSFDKDIPLYTFKCDNNTFVMYLKGTTPYIAYEKSQYMCQKQMNNISKATDFEAFFTEEQWIRLSPFIREDEYSDDNFLLTGYESEEERLDIYKELKESASKELKTLSQPSWEFSMNMANILALPEFESIINQFELGNFVRIHIRDGYVKRARLLEAQLGFGDLGDFSCIFGNLVTTKSEIDKHADLLAQAISAGKQVATSAGNWQKAVDTSNKINDDINSGLQNVTLEVGKANGQNIEIGQYGIWGRRRNDANTDWDPEQFRIINNRMVFTQDNFETTEAVFGKFTYKGETYYGVQAKALIGGLVDGTKIYGGEININDNFVVEADGTVKIAKGEISDYIKAGDIGDQIDAAFDKIMKDKTLYRTEIVVSGSTVFDSGNQRTTLECKVYNWDGDITDTLLDSSFKWKRTSNNSNLDAIWNADSNHMGRRTIQITPEDVQNNASFSCEVTFWNGTMTISLMSNQVSFIDMTDITIEDNANGSDIYTIRPSSYKAGDLWLTSSDTDHESYAKETLLKAQIDNDTYTASDWILAFDESCQNRVYASSPNVYLKDDGSFGKVVSPSQNNTSVITDITDENLNPYNILSIPVRQYQYTDTLTDKQAKDVYIGLINEEVAAIYPIASDSETWNVRTMVAAMLKIIQDQQNTLNELTQKVEELQK